jgi:2-polyprenyl-3-methyl-5-hydroxy-6-metoxy-1,4-benzoquinol methylase
MIRAKFTDQLLAPWRVGAKTVRHANMNLRRTGKRISSLQAWQRAVDASRRLVSWTRDVRLPVHRLASEARECPACGSSALVLLEPLRLYRYVDRTRIGFMAGCRGCGLLFVSPLPDSETLRTFYSPEGTWGRRHAAVRRDVLERQARRALDGIRKIDPPRRPRDFLIEAMARYLPIFDPPPDAAVLDFGCGDGKLLNVLAESRWKTFGIEPSTDVAFLRHTQIERIPDQPAFDLVVLHHVLEHVRRPLDLLQQLSAAMRSGAGMFISVPRLDTLPEHQDFRYCLNGRTHFVCFSEACLRELLARAGLELVATLSDPILDEQVTEGLPMRLRVVARKTNLPVPRVSRPLDGAVHALRQYRMQHPFGDRWYERLLPVRIQAFLLDREQRQRPDPKASAA